MSSFMSNLMQRMRRLPARLALLVAVVACPLSAHAQVLYGSLTGTVSDPSNLAVPGATVQALNAQTGVTKEATTDERGAFSFNDLQPGTYTITVSLEGFAPVSQEGVGVRANTTVRTDLKLQPKTVSESLVVTGRDAAIGLQTDRADVNIIQTSREVNNLPLTGSLGRNYQSLMTLVPGAVTMGEQNSAAGSPQRSISFNVNGVSRLQNNTRLDGSSVTYPWLPTNTAYVPSAEAIEAVNIVTNSFDAEQGMAGGAAVNVSIKSGSNDFHGTAWEFNTDSALRARNEFQTTAKNPVDVLNQYGGNLGGPIAKNKLFFFGNWEGTRRRQGAGDFSNTGVTIYDPASSPDPTQRTPFPNNIIPADRIDPAALALIQRLPMPTASGYVNNYTANGTSTTRRDNVDVKITNQVSDRLMIFGRYSISPTTIFDPPALGAAGGDALNGGQLGNAPGRTQVVGIGGNYTIGSGLLLDANIGYTRQRLGAQGPDIGTNYGLDLLHIAGTNGPDRLQSGLPFFAVSNWANIGNSNTGNPFLFRDNQYVGAANLTWMKGAHSFRFGGEYVNQQINHFQPQGGTFQTARGSFQFNGNMTRLQNGPAPSDTRYNSWADFLLGLPSAAGKVVQLRNPDSVYMESYAAYARDNWQMTRNLTLNFGVRWERYAWPTRDNGIGVSRFDPTTGLVYTGGLSGVPLDTGAKVGPGQFLPRIGAAYRLGEQTVIRAGYGLSSDPKPFIDFRNSYPISFAWSIPSATFNGVNNAFLPVTTLRTGLQENIYGVPPDLSQGIIPLPRGASTTTWPQDVQRKYIHTWNLTVQRELTSKITGQVGYVGTRVIGQMGFVNINASAPGTGDLGRPLAPLNIVSDINSIQPVGDVYYNGLQSQLTYHSGDTQVGVIYTFSKAINYQDNDGNPRIQYVPALQLDRGRAGYDRTHNFQAYWVLASPFGTGGKWLTSGLAGTILGDWQLNGVLSATSGLPFAIIQNSGGNLNAAGSAQVPDQIKSSVAIFNNNKVGTPPAGANPSDYQYFDRTAFAAVSIPAGQPQRFGNVGRNTMRGPGFFNIDLGLFRTVPLGGVYKVQFRAEALNVLNHPNFSNPSGDISSSGTFGYITSTTGTGERDYRFAVRFFF
jgi:Carboxypeptidase regulatory-like domain/TonB dependent receptor